MLATIADHIMSRRHRLGRHVLFIGSAVRIPPADREVYLLLEDLAREQTGMSFQHLPVERRGPATVAEFARQVPDQAQRCRLLREKLGEARPAEGHSQLARLIQDGYFPTIFTMEPHRLLEEALSTRHLEAETDYHLLVAGIDDAETISVALEDSSRVLIVKCGGDLASKHLPLTPEEIRQGLEPIGEVIDEAFGVMCVCTAYDERDEPFLDFVPDEGGKVFWVNRQVPTADEEMYTQLKLESPASMEFHSLQPKVVRWLGHRQSQRHLLVREPGSFNDFFARLRDRFQYRRHASRHLRRDLTVLRGGPYRFLDYFDTEDSDFFFGRDQEIPELIGLIEQHRLTVLFGRSGIGKTSLIKAGVMARLLGRHEEHLDDAGVWLPIYARCQDEPIANIRQAALQRIEEEGYDLGDSAELEQLSDLLSAIASTSQRRVVVFLDQAEELFVKLGGPARDSSIEQLKQCLANGDERISLVLSIREDYLGELYEIEDELPGIMENLYRLHKLDKQQAEQAIVQPAENFGLHVERKLVDRLVEDLAREGVEPVELQVVCDRLYEQKSAGSDTITQRDYEKLGGAPKIFSEYLDYALSQLPILERRVAKAILKQMAISSELKAARSLGRIAQEVGQDARSVERVLAKLVDFRLLRGLGKDKQRNYELIHEQLMQQVDEWMSEEELKLRDVQDLLTRELNNFQKFDLLMDSEELHIINDHREDLSISPEEMELILRSVIQQDFEVEYWLSRADELEAAKSSVLSSLLTDENREVRLVAYRHIEDHLDESLIPALTAGLDYDQPEVHNLAAQYLRGMKRELSNWLRNGDEHQQMAAARGLGHVAADDQRPAPALIETLSDEHTELTAEVIHYLRKTDSPRNISTLINRITSEPDAPWAVADALGRLCSAEAGLDRLQRAAHNNPKSARLQYAIAVAYIQRREFEEARTRLERAEQLASGSAAVSYLAEAREAMQAAQQQSDAPTDQWAMFAGGPAHHGFSEQAITPPLHEIWSTRTQAAVVASPVTTAGRIYIGARDGTFFALDGVEGHVLWTFAAGGPIEGAAALAGDMVILGAGDGRLYALNQATGQRQWERALSGPIRGACTVEGDQLFVGNDSGILWAVDWATGTIDWQMATDQEIISAPAVCEETVVVGSWDTGLYAANRTDGQLRWRLDTDGPISCSPTINESTVFCGSDDFSMYAVDLASGQIQWQVNVGGMVRSAPAIAGNRLVFGSTDGSVYCLDVNTGEQLWQHATDEEVLASATITDQVVYIGSKDGVLYALDLASGQVEWEHRTVYGIYSTPCVAAGTLYISIAYYYVSAFAPQ